MGVPTSEVVYTPAMPRREDHEVHKGHVVALEKKNIKAKIRCLHQRHCCKKPSGLLVCVLGLNVGVEGGTQLCHCCEVHYDYKLL